MKRIILLLILVLGSDVLFSQITKELTCNIPEGKQVGDTLTGKHAKYKLYADNSGVFSVLQNLENCDTVNLRLIDPKGTIRPSTVLACFDELFTKIVGEFLTLSEKAIYKKAGGDIIVACRLKEGKIEELSFWWFKMLPFPEDDPEMQGEMGRAIVEKYKMLRRISVDRFLEIEKALKERVDFSGLEWIEKEGIYLKMSVDSCYMD
ncbi:MULTISPECIES: hypothetical protein [Butyricimonas]|uniref:hypothetical protein n=1 Tax=Butyricimonas TaxID=574697 RepID=UPI0007FB5357|nr:MULTISPECIES: hypothetical protein [Butyricimonas]